MQVRNILQRLSLYRFIPSQSSVAPAIVSSVRWYAEDFTPKKGFIQRVADQYQQKRGLEFFQEHLSWLSKLETFGLNEFKEQLQRVEKASNMGGVGKFFSSVTDHPIMQDVARQKSVVEGFTEEERANPAKIDRVVKKRVAETTKVETQMVNETLRRFELARQLHEWLRNRIAEGKPMPKDQEELTMAIRATAKRRMQRVGSR